MAHRIGKAAALAALTVWSAGALAQHAVRPKDAEAPVAVPAQSTPDAEPLVNTPGARKQTAPAEDSDVKQRDAGPPQAFKDDITAEDIKEQSSAKSAAADCAGGGCEAILTRTLESTAFTLHIRPSQPKPGRVAEIVLEVSEVMDPPDPEFGERKPMTGEKIVAHVEGVGRFLMHPVERNDGAYGFHFTPGAAGTREIGFDRLNGRPGLKVTFNVPVGQPAPKGAELRDWRAPGPDRYQSVSVAPAGRGSSEGEGE